MPRYGPANKDTNPFSLTGEIQEKKKSSQSLHSQIATKDIRHKLNFNVYIVN